MTAQRLKIEKTCLLCGSIFHPWDTHPGNYCSAACSQICTLNLSAPLGIRFWQHVTKTDGCWLWSGANDGKADGYGRLVTKGKTSIGAHRISWELHKGPIPDGLWVLHTCDNRRCVNPAHLFLGTHMENQRDAWNKGRQRAITRQGQRNGQTTLSAADVVTIRNWSPEVPAREFAKHYGVAEVTIYHIRERRLWAQIA